MQIAERQTTISSGYKQTEVGPIPEDWSVESLGRIADPKRPICYGIVQVGQFSNNGVPVLAIKNLNGDYVTSVHLCSHEIEKQYARSRVHPGDVLVSVKGTIGRIGLVPPHFCGNISRDLARIALTDSDIPAFWYQLLQSDMAQRRLEATTVGTTRMELSIGPLKEVKMPRPSKEEQRAIATALSDADALLSVLERLMTKKRDLKQAAMQQLLTGKKRLPGFSDEWEMKTVSRFGEVITGGTPPTGTKEYWGGEIPWVTPTDISEKKDISTTERQITPKGLDSVRALPANSVLVTCIASIGKNAVLRRQGACNQQINAIVPNCDNNADFLYYLFEGNKQFLLSNAGITATHIISKKEFGELSFQVPQNVEQKAIAGVLSDMDAEIAALETHRDKTRELKQGMMQELLTGKTRLIWAKATSDNWSDSPRIA